ncbi:MAG TPA: hypothetical protein VJU59_44945 [Paraburkholderia sp.]|uniref:hypothetical protein n=1 Tax=Paraburkholderia sp. TaxID=1926495 RepID=UPI002B4A7FB6|nr:hypothetical protein [Paraburkholderia sp.]HKR46739.1 hypothetical protein [Paraburkholderia sp.]
MQSTYIGTQSVSSSDKSRDNSTRREILKLSDLDSQTMSDLAGMFGLWKETDHCDKDDR